MGEQMNWDLVGILGCRMTSQASLREPMVVCQTQTPDPPFPGNSAICEEDTWLVYFSTLSSTCEHLQGNKSLMFTSLRSLLT